MSEYAGVERPVPSEAEVIHLFLKWAREHNIHLASQGRPPFGRQGTWFISEYNVPELIDSYVAYKAHQERKQT